MTTGNISVFSQPIVKADVTAQAQGKDDIDLTEAELFSEFMDRSASMQAPDINAGKQEKAAYAQNASPEESYNKMQSETHSNVRSKDKSTDKIDTVSSETKNTVSGKAEKIKEAIKDELKVSDEDIEKVMDLLGLTEMDLFDQNALIQLVTELTGAESAVDLLSMPGMSDLLDAVAGIKTELATELSVSESDLGEILKLMEEPEVQESFTVYQDVVQAQDENVVSASSNDAGALAQVQEASDSQDTGDVKTLADGVAEKASVTTAGADKTTASNNTSQTDNSLREEAVDDEKSVRVENLSEDKSGNTGDSGESFEQGDTGAQKAVTAHNEDDAARAVTHNANTTDAVIHANTDVQAAQMDEVSGYLDVDSLIEQFATLTKNLENEQTTLSMRLNPENLGQLTLHVTEKQGNLTAEVRVENEQVRDALNTQIAELRANLESAGVKVTAVEVTVESHEFESAYENQAGSAATGDGNRDGRPSETPEEAMEKITGIRNINLNNPEEIADNLTEAEIVNASVMRDHGNSVDFRA